MPKSSGKEFVPHGEKHNAILLRGYRPGDWKTMHALDMVCFAPPFRFGPAEMRRLAEERNAVSLMAEAGAELVGFCIAHRDDKWGYLITLDVAPAWRRRGIATRLMQEVETELRTAATAGMGLHVHTENADAIRFYERLGYKRTGVAEGFYGAALDAFVYRRIW